MDAAAITRLWSSQIYRFNSSIRSTRHIPSTSQRCFSTQTSTLRQQAAAVRSPPAPRASPATSNEGAAARSQNMSRPATLDAKDRELLNKGLDREGEVGISSSPHTTRHKTPSAQAPRYTTAPLIPRSRSAPTAQSAPQSSLSDMTSAYGNFNSRQSQPLSNTILFPTAPKGSAFPTEAEKSPPKISNIRYESLHLTTRSGLTLQVESAKNVDLGAKLRALSQIVGRNRVKQDVFRQRFHERGGLKRKRLHSERWRRRFKDNFTTIVNRVQDLRKQGW